LPEEVKRIAWKAQLRLNHKFRRLVGRGKPRNKAVVAMAREVLGFIWAIAHEVRIQQLSQAADWQDDTAGCSGRAGGSGHSMEHPRLGYVLRLRPNARR